MSAPHITTAIPKRRYQYGEFMITVLGDIQSTDPAEYRYLFAVATESEPTPGLFIAAEAIPPEQRKDGMYALRVSMTDGSQLLGHSDRWGDLDVFVTEALDITARILNLSDETPHRLL